MMYLSHLNSLNSWWCIGLFVTWQVRWDDQSQYHQEIESVFVGGRLSFLLPPPAGMVIGLFETECDTHTHGLLWRRFMRSSLQVSLMV